MLWERRMQECGMMRGRTIKQGEAAVFIRVAVHGSHGPATEDAHQNVFVYK